MEARLLTTKQTQTPLQKYQQPPRKKPTFVDLKPYLFNPNLLFFFFKVVNSQNYSQISDMELQKLYFLQITEIWDGSERATRGKKDYQVQLLQLASGWVGKKGIARLSVRCLCNSTSTAEVRWTGRAWQSSCLLLVMCKTKGTCSARYCFNNLTKMIVFTFCEK